MWAFVDLEMVEQPHLFDAASEALRIEDLDAHFLQLRRSIGSALRQGHGDFTRLTLGQTEIHQVRRAIVTDHDVGWLDIAMDHALLMGVLQGIGHHRD
jgi:hypothetical protein